MRWHFSSFDVFRSDLGRCARKTNCSAREGSTKQCARHLLTGSRNVLCLLPSASGTRATRCSRISTRCSRQTSDPLLSTAQLGELTLAAFSKLTFQLWEDFLEALRSENGALMIGSASLPRSSEELRSSQASLGELEVPPYLPVAHFDPSLAGRTVPAEPICEQSPAAAGSQRSE